MAGLGLDRPGDLFWPPTGPQALLASFSFHFERYGKAKDTCTPPNEEELDLIADYLVSNVHPGSFDSELTWDWFDKVVTFKFDSTSSAGIPWNKRVSCLGDFKENEELKRLLFSDFLARLGDLAVGRVSSDPINAFIKVEPHAPRKVRNNAWRIISGISIVDTLVDHFLFGGILDMD